MVRSSYGRPAGRPVRSLVECAKVYHAPEREAETRRLRRKPPAGTPNRLKQVARSGAAAHLSAKSHCPNWRLDNGTKQRYHWAVNTKQRVILKRIFTRPTAANLKWSDAESLLLALGATIRAGSGSRVRIELGGIRLTTHTPHPQKEMDKGAVDDLRTLLERAGVNPDEEQQDA